MIKLKQLITERFLNLFSVEDKAKYVDEVWNILQTSYKSIGGYKGVVSKKELIDDTGLWKLVRKGGKIVALRLYKDKFGRKSVASGTDGSDLGKTWLLKIYQEDTDFNRSWGEVSGKVEEILIKKYGAQPVPNKFAEKILKKKIHKFDPDGFHYYRSIGGTVHRKIILVGDSSEFLSKIKSQSID